MILHTKRFIFTYRNSIAFLLLSLLSGALNYLYYPLISHTLNVEDFGISQSLITLLTQIGSLFAGLSILSIYFVKKYGSTKATAIINVTQKVIIFALLFLTAIVAAFHGQISQFLNIADNINVIIVAIDLALSIPFVVTFGFMLAEHRFVSASLMQLSVVATKLLLGLLLVSTFGNVAAIGVIGISYLVGMAVFWIASKAAGKKPWEHNVLRSYIPPVRKELKLFAPYAITVILILVSCAVLVALPGLDVIIARHNLDATTAGAYSAASTISSILLFAGLPVVNLLVPLIGAKNTTTQQIKKALALLVTMSLISMLAFIFIPNMLLMILGGQYLKFESILWVYGLNMLFICFFTAFIQVTLLYRTRLAFVISVLTLVIAISAATINHNSAQAVITSTATSYGTIVVICAGLALYYLKRGVFGGKKV